VPARVSDRISLTAPIATPGLASTCSASGLLPRTGAELTAKKQKQK